MKKEHFETILAFVVTAILCLAILGLVMWMTRGVINWIRSATTVTQEEADAKRKSDELWAKNPLNPDLIAQKCLDAGGYPKRSSWDGSISCHDKGGGNKDVKIEVNQ